MQKVEGVPVIPTTCYHCGYEGADNNYCPSCGTKVYAGREIISPCDKEKGHDFSVSKDWEITILNKTPRTSAEQKALEDSLNALLNDVNANKKALQKLDKDLLQRLT